jgi:para-aminobenzoate synthetase
MAHVLLIDSYDSFSFKCVCYAYTANFFLLTNMPCSLAALCINAIPGSKVHIIHNDDFTFEELRPHLKSFDAIVVGPGPGSPTVPTDIGVIPALWQLSKEELLPIFGVCLGMQSLGVEHGAKIQRLNVPKHGILADVKHNATHLFGGLDRCTVVRYHSLHVTLEEGGVLEELAYVDDGAENGHVVMGVRHTSKPFSVSGLPFSSLDS